MPKKFKTTFTFDPAFHVNALREIEDILDEYLADHPSPNSKNIEGVEGDIGPEIAENYEAVLSIKNMLTEAADRCDEELCLCDE